VTAERWARLTPLLDAFLDLAPERRAAYVDQVRSSDASLGAQLERCIAESDGEDALLERWADARAAMLFDGDDSLLPDGDLRATLQEALGSRYTLVHELGGGGMSRVFVADEPALGRKVVIKVVEPERLPGVSAARFAQEIRLAAALQQANIVPLLSAGSAGGVPYYTMPLVDGRSLLERLEREGALPIRHAVSILRDVARALAYAHARGVVHRDIKPGNVLLSGGTAVVTDFGIAKALDMAVSETEELGAAPEAATAGIGTPAYMAPEQAMGDAAADHRADLYAFGCLAYAVLTGTPPFSGRPARKVIEAHVVESPRPIAELRPDVPPRIAALIARCLEKDPAKRPQTASEVLDELDAESDRTSGWRPATRLVAAGVAAVAILSALGAFVAQRQRAAEGSAPALTLAVVPFRNVARDTALEYLADGISDELLTSMGKVRGVRVTGRSAAYRFKRQPDANVQAVQRVLGARLLVTGSMQRRNGQLIVSAQLNDSMSRGELWSETYVRDAKDIGVVSDDIGRAITDELRKHFGTMIGAHDSASVGTTNKDALDLYLVGNALVKRRGSGIVQGAAYFERAIAADSNFARAYAALAMALQYNTYFLGTPAEELRERTTSAARRAIALDSTLAEPHVALGSMYFQLSDDAHAVAEFQRALALDPNDVNARFTYGRFLMTRVRPAEALVQFRRAQRSERVSPLLSIWAGYAHFLLGHADSAALESALAVQLDSTLMPVVNIAALINLGLGRPDVARRVVAVGVPQEAMSILPHVYARLGDTVAAMRLVHQMEAHRPPLWFAGEARASVYLAIGDTARALAAYEQAGRVSKSYLNLADPAFDPIRGSARFAALVRRSGLDPAALAALRASARAQSARVSALRKS
jgi:serine/threonine-protein kinase